MYYRHWKNPPSDKSVLKREIHNIDQDIIKILFALDSERLHRFFREYKRTYGESATNYAKKAFNSWKTGVTSYSAQSIKRFIEIVPRIISNSERYDIIKKLYEKSKSQSTYNFEIVLGDYQALSSIVKTFKSLCEKPFSHNLSDEFKHQMQWLCDNDAMASNKLLSAFDTESSLLVSKAAKKEIDNLINKISNLDGSAVGTHECNFPFGQVTIVVRKPTFFEKIVKSIR